MTHALTLEIKRKNNYTLSLESEEVRVKLSAIFSFINSFKEHMVIVVKCISGLH